MEKIRIMLVDDDRLAISYLESIVDWENLGYEIVAVAYNGKQALRMVETYSPQLVITDIIMPHMNGIELSRKVKEISKDIRVVLLTAYGEFEYAREAVQLGVDYYLIKDEIDEVYMEEKLNILRGLIKDTEQVSRLVFQKAVVDYFQMGEEYVRECYKEKALKEFLDGAYDYLLIEQNLPIALDEKWEIRMEQNDFPAIVDECLKLANCNGLKIRLHCILPENRILFVLEKLEKREYEEQQRHFFAARQLCMRLNEKEKGRYTVYVTDYRIPFRNLYQLLEEEKGILEAKYFLGTGRVYSLMKQPLKEETLPDLPSKEEIGRMLLDEELGQNIKSIYDGFFLRRKALRPLFSYFKMVYQTLFQEEKKYSILLFDNDSMCGRLFDYQEIYVWLLDYEQKLRGLRKQKEKRERRHEVERARYEMKKG